MGKRVWLGIFGMICLLQVGCCSMCDRWCGQRGAPAYAAPAGCIPCAPAPPAVCCPTPVGSSPAAGWQRPPAPPYCP